ncbi:MAG TPA: 30S ribosomal protein S11 [Candidatus Saccharimonadales bacterium]|jgi:small subunit ribosomal protein S11|nr:30S ribosomal protein S11 [Candidatus Saccharimonadales bacterium]
MDDTKDIQTPVAETPVAPVIKKKKNKRAVPEGQVHIKSTFNNTIITFTDPTGGVLSASSAGACGFRGSKKSTAFAAQIAMEKAAGLVKQNYSLSKVDVFVKGLGLGRDSAVRALQTSDIFVNSISDVTGLPHGGCRPRKARRM